MIGKAIKILENEIQLDHVKTRPVTTTFLLSIFFTVVLRVFILLIKITRIYTQSYKKANMIKVRHLVEKKIKSEQVFDGRLLKVFVDTIELPDNNTSTRDWIKHPGACAVIPLYENGDIMMIRQFRYPMAQIFWEVPAGKIDAGENPDQTAIRELKEETGLSAQTMDYVGHFYPAIGYADEVIHIYVASGLSENEQEMDDDEFVYKERIPFKQAIEMIHSGEINDGKTVICLLRMENWLKRRDYKS